MTRPVDAHVSEADAFTLALERDPGLRATIVAVAVLDRSPAWERLVARMDRATKLVPSFRCRLVASPLGLAPPRWVEDPDFDLSWHLRRIRLRAGADIPDLWDLARTMAMDAFDHDRPLWEFTLVEGLPDGRAAWVLKVHHALTDGIGGIQIAAHVVDLTRDGPDPEPLADPSPVRRARPLEPLAEAIGHDLRAAAGVGADAVRGAPGTVWRWLRDPLGSSADALFEVGSILRTVRPVTDTRSPVMVERSLHRHFEAVDVPLDALHAAAARHGATLNDAFLAALAGGLRRYHEAHTACVNWLRVTMPISVRGPDDGPGGNRVTLVRLDLPVGVTDPVRRLAIIHAICDAERHEPALGRSEAIAGVLNRLPIGITGGMLHHVDLLASNVPGIEAEVFVAGARLDAFYAFGATLGSAANITLLSSRGVCHVGIVTDGAAVPDPDVFAACVRDGFDEVVGA
jgi:WS/DGAT/MGAT family acyltransferase